MTALRRSVAGIVAVIALAGCDRRGAPVAAEPKQPRVEAVIEPEKLRIGEYAVVKITVVTPPQYALSPAVTPATPPEIEILRLETPPISVRPGRWAHVTRFHVRTRGVGDFEWPASEWTVTAPDGSVELLRTRPVPIRVASVRPDHPDRTVPFGARPAPPLPTRGIGAMNATLTLLLTAAAIRALVVAHRRWRRRRPAAAASAAPATPPWSTARKEFSRARESLQTDATKAADATAAALRRYMGGRFGAAAVARTTEELEASTPPFGARSRWPTFVELLSELDSVRFPPRDRFARDLVTQRVEDLLRRSETFVETSLPPEPLR